MSTFTEKLNKRRTSGNLRTLKVRSDLVDFCSNDYLGFARKLKIPASSEEIFSQSDTWTGSTGSRLVSGNSLLAESLEKAIADFHGAASGLIFNSGYDANLGLFSCIAERNDTIVYDALSHASIRDGIRLSFSRSFSFKHNDPDDLEKKLIISKGNIFISVESVYSMDGDFAPLREISALALKYGAKLIVDEAHATGVFGERGQGKVSELGLQNEIFARVHTFGKALGSHGAIVLGSNELRQYLINFARPFIYSTALPPHSLLTIARAYKLLDPSFNINERFDSSADKAHDNVKSLRSFKFSKETNSENGCSNAAKALMENIALFRQLSGMPEDAIGQNSPIQIVIIPGNETCRNAAEFLENAGFDVRAILSPTVPKGKERLRICMHAFNSVQEVVDLSNALKELGFKCWR